MAKQARTTTKTAQGAKAPKREAGSEEQAEELVKLEVIASKPIKIGNAKVGKGYRGPFPKSQADALIKDGAAVKVY